MTQLSCFQGHQRPIIERDVIILNTSDVIKTLRLKTSRLKELDADEDHLLQLVVEALGYEKTAQMEIAYGCMDVIRQYLDVLCDEEFSVIAEALFIFGDALFAELKRVNAYRKGYLFYQYMQTLGNDIVLVKLVPPELNKHGDINEYWGYS